MSKKQNKKVFVGLSGGVDSSVSAALLKDAGYDVTGVFIKTWHPEFLPCTWRQDRLDAMRVAARLGIPFKTYDFEKEYKEDVADYMISEYSKGRTPNPDVMCNKYVKFGAFLKKALEEGADFIATGHYAQIKKKKGICKLFAGADQEKDQTYFLWTLGPNELKYTLFPVGVFKKSRVRKLARKYNLPTAEKKDSQGICFLGALDMQEFLKRYIEPKEGDVLSMSGEKIGFHDGAVFYTFGQRHGFTVTKKRDNEKPLYVTGKDAEKNTITVSEMERNLSGSGCGVVIEDVNWTVGLSPEEDQEMLARFRYRQELFPVKVAFGQHENINIYFTKPERVEKNWAPGQSLVLYKGKCCVGGGIIAGGL